MNRLCCALALTLAACAAAMAQPLPGPASPRPVQRFEYDANGNLRLRIQTGTAVELATAQDYDPLNRLRALTDARGGQTALQRDGQGALRMVTDPIGVRTVYHRDGMGQVLAEDSPDSGSRLHTWDAAGRLATSRDARGVLSTHTYDALGRLRRLTHDGSRNGAGLGVQEFTWNYDESGPVHGHGIGRLTSSQFPGGTTALSYDAWGRVVHEQRTLEVEGRALHHALAYGWDAAGRLAWQQYPSGRTLNFTIVGAQVVAASLTSPLSGAQTIASAMEWEPFGPPRAWRWGYAATPRHEVSRDLDGRVTRQSLGPWVREITYDTWDRLTRIQHRPVGGGSVDSRLTQSFVHDELGRLTRWTLGTHQAEFGYDPNGNRTYRRLNGATTWLGREAGTNRLSVLAAPLRTAQYDAAGNLDMTSDGVRRTHDAAGRLAALTWDAGGQASFMFDDRHRRVRASFTGQLPAPEPPSPPIGPPQSPGGSAAGGSSDTVFVYDTMDRLIGEYNALDGAPERGVLLAG